MISLKDIAGIFEEIELRLISSLKRNLKRHTEWEEAEGFQWSAWQAEKIRNVAAFRRENAAIVRDYVPLIDEATRNIMEEQFSEGEMLAQEAYEAAEETLTDNYELRKEPLPSFFGTDRNKLDNLIHDITTLETKVETAALRMTDDVYRQTLHRVQLAMATGSMTLNQALDIAVGDFLKNGLNCIVYSDGRRVNIADYVRMALRTTSTRAQLQGQAQRARELGYDTVLVSQYSMCSETCLPYQGKVYIDDVFADWQGERVGDSGISGYCGKVFPLLSSAIRGGLFHPNCRHTITLWIEGRMKLPKPHDGQKVRERSMLEQKQRRFENKIRKLKRLVEGSFDSENIKENKRKLKETQKQLREFIDEHSDILRRDYSKEKIYTADKPKTVDKSGESGIIKESSKKAITPITDTSVERVPNVKISGYTDEQCSIIQQQHKELLKYSRDNNENKEVAFVFDSELKNRKEFKGFDDRLDFGSSLYGKDLCVMHNHPRNSSYSFNDIVEFIANDSIKTLTIVKNNGNAEILTKLTEYDKLAMLKELQRLEKNNIKTGSDNEYRKIIDKFLNKHIQGGLIEWLK